MNKMRVGLLGILLLGLGVTPVLQAKPGEVKNGESIYLKRCIWCHGEEGDGLGASAERLNPPPRDFTAGTYKIKTTGFDDMVPNDEDIFRMIRDGMPSTAMPGWSDVLSDQEMWDLVAYIKVFAGYDEEKPSDQVDYGTQIATSPESIEKGKKLFLESDRCVECHGKQGKGDAVKRLKGDNGERTWPRNLTKPWTFRGSNDPKDIFTRITTGIPGTEMPSFNDPASKLKLSIEQRWHVANFVSSLGDSGKMVNPKNTVIKAEQLEGELPDSPEDPGWEKALPSTFYLVPQIIAKQRFFTPSNDTITVRALFNDKEIAFLIEWDDRTNSIPGDDRAVKIADPPIAEDAVAIQLPVTIPKGTEKPYFGMGDATHAVNIWHWSSGSKKQPQAIKLLTSQGFKKIKKRDSEAVGLQAQAKYDQGAWKVVMKRPLQTADSKNDIQFVEGKFIPIAFAAWDGSNSEKGSRHTMTTWYWLLLKPQSGAKPFIFALIAIFLVAGLLVLWQRNASLRATKA